MEGMVFIGNFVVDPLVAWWIQSVLVFCDGKSKFWVIFTYFLFLANGRFNILGLKYAILKD